MQKKISRWHTVVSLDNQLIKKVVKLARDVNFRAKEQCSVVYGMHLLEEALQHHLLQKIFVVEGCEHLIEELFCKVNINVDAIMCYRVNSLLMQKMNILDGAIKAVGIVAQKLVHQVTFDLKDYVLLDRIQDPHNLGNMFRIIKAFGVQDVLLAHGCVDPFNPKVLRASQGAQFGLNITVDVDFLNFMKIYRGTVLVTSSHAKQAVYEFDLSNKLAWIFGSEGSGVSEELLAQVLSHVYIPIDGEVESLNVANASAVCLYEMQRQRMSKKK